MIDKLNLNNPKLSNQSDLSFIHQMKQQFYLKNFREDPEIQEQRQQSAIEQAEREQLEKGKILFGRVN